MNKKQTTIRANNFLNYVFIIILILSGVKTKGQVHAYKPGEYFKFKIHYGFFNAGFATLNLQTDMYQQKKMFHAIGKGWTTGISSWFMEVDDHYESYFDSSNRPYKFIRKIDEGGYTKDKKLFFNHSEKKVSVVDIKKNKKQTFSIPETVQDMVSVFYYLRNYNTSNLKPGDVIVVNMFFDEEVYPFKLKLIGRTTLKTKFGKIKSLIFRPIVQSGRVFKEDESLTVWISDDQNKMPLLIKAKLLVGSLKASLIEYKGLKYPVNFKS